MYTPAPHVNGNGTLSVQRTIYARSGVWSNSYADALRDAFIPTFTGSAPSGQTVRASCQNGTIGYKKYRPTDYSAIYRTWTASGYVTDIIRDIPIRNRWQSRGYMIGLGYTGFQSTGLNDYLEFYDHSGSSAQPEALYNRFVMANLLNRAISECRQKAANQQMDLAEALTGLPQTVLRVAQRASQVLKAWNHARKGNWTGAVSALGINPSKVHQSLKNKSLASAWLEIQYGWRPLLSDIYSGMALANDLLNPQVNPKQLHVVRRLSETYWGRNPSDFVATQWTGLQVSTAGTASVEVRYDYRISDSTIAFLNSLSVLNPLYVGWVAVPFSFVVDWLIPVGDWLQSLSSTLGLQFVSGYSTRRSFGRATASATGRAELGPSNPTLYRAGSTSAAAELCRITRIAYTSWPWPVPYIRFPFSSDERVANAIALITTSRKHR
jgi:hypothetical protein